MSIVNLTINKVKSTDSHTLLCGELNLKVPSPNSILCQPLYNFPKNSIILDRNSWSSFKTYFSDAPVYPNTFSVYDQNGLLLSTYTDTRTNNYSGTIDITSEPKTLLSDIVIQPLSDDEQTFIILTSYEGLTSCLIDEHKKHIITSDMDMFKAKYDLSKVILFVVDTIYNEMSCYYDLSKIFKQVHVTIVPKVLPLLFIEYVVGKFVSGSKPDFQGFLNFGPNVEVVSSHFNHVENRLFATNRRRGRVHISSNTTSSTSHFLILLSHSSPSDIMISESTTSTHYDLVVSPNEMVKLSDSQMETMMNGLLFMEDLIKFTGDYALLQYLLQADSVKVVSYLYDSPIMKSFKYDPSVNSQCLDSMIMSYMYYVQDKISQKLSYKKPVLVHQPPAPLYNISGNLPRQVSSYLN
jgi:hypothetical protein